MIARSDQNVINKINVINKEIILKLRAEINNYKELHNANDMDMIRILNISNVVYYDIMRDNKTRKLSLAVIIAVSHYLDKHVILEIL